jgi:hypothetical protein
MSQKRVKVFNALDRPQDTWCRVSGIARQTGLAERLTTMAFSRTIMTQARGGELQFSLLCQMFCRWK